MLQLLNNTLLIELFLRTTKLLLLGVENYCVYLCDEMELYFGRSFAYVVAFGYHHRERFGVGVLGLKGNDVGVKNNARVGERTTQLLQRKPTRRK